MNGHLHGYEIKSDSDTLDRLPSQIATYGLVLDRATLVVGDAYIADCAAGAVTTGNLSTWVWVSTNHHLTKVVDDLARLNGLSIAAE